MKRKLHIKENNKNSNDVMSLLKGIPEKDIDHHETDLYLRKTPEVTKNVIDKLPDVYKKNVTTFIDNIDHVEWYEIPFVFSKGKNRKESINTDTRKPIKEDYEVGDIVSWNELNDAQKEYALKNIYRMRNFAVLVDEIWSEDIMDTYHYDVEELAKNLGITDDVNIDKLYWQSNSQGPYPEWDLSQVFDVQYVQNDDFSIIVDFYGKSTDVKLDLTVEYRDAEGDWMTDYSVGDIDDIENADEYTVPENLINQLRVIENKSQDFIDGVWSYVHDVCTSYPDDEWIDDLMSANDYGDFEILSDTKAFWYSNYNDYDYDSYDD